MIMGQIEFVHFELHRLQIGAMHIKSVEPSFYTFLSSLAVSLILMDFEHFII